MLIKQQPGTVHNRAIHGVTIKSFLDCTRVHDNDGPEFAMFCIRFGIPTGVPVSVATWEAASKALYLRYDIRLRDAAIAEALILAAADHMQVAA